VWGKKAWKIYSSPQRLPYSDEQVGKDGVSYVAVCCSVLQCVAVCCSVLQCVAVCCSVLQCHLNGCHTPMSKSAEKVCPMLQCVAVCCSVLQCVAVCCSVLQCVAVSPQRLPYSDEQVGKDGACLGLDLVCVAVCCNMLQRVATCCSVLQAAILRQASRQRWCVP